MGGNRSQVRSVGEPGKRQGSRRRYQRRGQARTRWVRIRLSEVEYTTLAAAADRLGMAVGAYVAEAAMASAREVEPPQWSPLRELLAALMQASAQVRRVGVNYNQAVAALHATGEPTAALEGYAALAARTAGRLDDIAEEVRTRLP